MSARTITLWRVFQLAGLLIIAALILGLFTTPERSLHLLWNVFIPVLPATFLIAPALWRGVCPLATINMSTNGVLKRKNLSVASLSWKGTLGIGLLFLLVPARRFLFNQQGVPLAIVVLLVIVAALVLGAVFNNKAGFCNAICPVLPVEKLYGQHPLLKFNNPRCAPCALCTSKGCLDLVPDKSAMRALGPKQRSKAWLTTSYGIFAAAFPGFVLGYFMAEDGFIRDAGSVYLTVFFWAVISYFLVVLLVLVFKIEAKQLFPVLAASAIGCYYWLAAPGMADTWGGNTVTMAFIRSAALLLVCVWLFRALQRVHKHAYRPFLAKK